MLYNPKATLAAKTKIIEQTFKVYLPITATCLIYASCMPT